VTTRRPVLGTDDLRLLRDGLRTVQERLEDVRVTVESDDGLIVATLGGRGELLTLDLDPRIYRTPDSRALATAITATIRRAREQVAERAAALTRHALRPGDDPAFGPLLRRLDHDIAAERS
jgi:DNA-binding protein YbaB